MSSRIGIAVVMGTVIVLAAVGISALPTTAAIPAAQAPDTVRSTSAMGEARAAHTATALIDGDVLIVGGFTGKRPELAGTELFDQQHERFERIAQPRMVRRQSHTATRLRDGKVLDRGRSG